MHLCTESETEHAYLALGLCLTEFYIVEDAHIVSTSSVHEVLHCSISLSFQNRSLKVKLLKLSRW